VHTTQPSWQGVQVSSWWNETFRIHTNTWEIDWRSLHLWLVQNLHKYLWHCLQCQLNQTPHHKPYEVLQSILSLLRPFHTLTIDFILALSVIKASETYETIMSVTDKFSKTVTLISERDTMTVKDWAICLLNCLALLNWELFKAIISDWDRKFLFSLWKEIFKQLKVDLLYSTAYHSQTDDSSEMTNKTVEIALQYWIMTLKCSEEWPKVYHAFKRPWITQQSIALHSKASMRCYLSVKPEEALNLLCVAESETQTHKMVDVHSIQLMIMNNYQSAHWRKRCDRFCCYADEILLWWKASATILSARWHGEPMLALRVYTLKLVHQ
jgi:hypothetical protein